MRHFPVVTFLFLKDEMDIVQNTRQNTFMELDLGHINNFSSILDETNILFQNCTK